MSRPADWLKLKDVPDDRSDIFRAKQLDPEDEDYTILRNVENYPAKGETSQKT
jgi:hypothetical protein